MQLFSRNDEVDIDLYEDRLNRTGEIYVVLTDIGMYAQQQLCRAITLQRLCLKYMNLHSKIGYSGLNSDTVRDYLQRNEGVPKKNFKKKGVQEESLDKKKVVIPLLENGYAPDFLNMFIGYQESTSRSNNMTALYKRHSQSKKIRGWEEMLTPIPFTANRNVNLRFNYSKENLVSLPRDMSQVIKAKEGYVLAWGDFAQSDARIAYNLLLRDNVNIKYINAFPDDIYAGFANWVQEFQKIEIQQQLEQAKKFRQDVIKETGQDPGTSNIELQQKLLSEWKPFTGFKNKAERELYKVYVLETIYGTRHHKVAKAAKFIAVLGRVLDSCEKYKKFWDDIKKRASFGVPVRVHCYMGHVEMVPAFDGPHINETLFKCLNYPVQGGTSEIMIVTVNRILDTFYALGYTEEDIHVYYIRHDEPVFEMKKSAMKDSWILSDYSNIQVDDWTPLKLEFSFGRTYKEEESELMEAALLSTKINAEKLGKFKPSEIQEDYYPLEKLLEVAIKIERLSDTEALLAIYEIENNSFIVKLIPTPQDVENKRILYLFIEKYLKNVYSEGYRQMVIYHDGDYYEDDINGTIPITRLYRPSSNQAMHRASIIAAAAVAAKQGVEADIVKQNRAFLSTLRKCTLFGGG